MVYKNAMILGTNETNRSEIPAHDHSLFPWNQSSYNCGGAGRRDACQVLSCSHTGAKPVKPVSEHVTCCTKNRARSCGAIDAYRVFRQIIRLQWVQYIWGKDCHSLVHHVAENISVAHGGIYPKRLRAACAIKIWYVTLLPCTDPVRVHALAIVPPLRLFRWTQALTSTSKKTTQTTK